MKVLANLDLVKNQLQNASIQPLATAPSSPVNGQVYFDTTDEKLKIYNEAATAWEIVGDDVFNNTITVAAGAGLTGDSSFTLNQSSDATITLAVGAGTGLDAAANSINLDFDNLPAIAESLSGLDEIIIVNESSSDEEKLPVSTLGTYIESNHIGSGTVDIVAGDGLAVDEDSSFGLNDSGDSTIQFSVDSSVVRTSGAQTIAGAKTFSDNMVINGDLTVSGTTTTVNSNEVNIGDAMILLNSDETGAPSQDAGIEIERGTSSNVQLRWNESMDRWEYTNDGTNFEVIASVDYVDDSHDDNVHTGTFSASGATSQAFNHGWGTRSVQVEVYDSVSKETVWTDVTRNDEDEVTISVAQLPANDLVVIVTRH